MAWHGIFGRTSQWSIRPFILQGLASMAGGFIQAMSYPVSREGPTRRHANKTIYSFKKNEINNAWKNKYVFTKIFLA